ncbi:MAG TPA: RelA/SpoT domain-containing protein [Symbiobacteriaceae bacterium]|nr:RelA/SpoT domain-containing protein [Symbiobacteriaceae bacterium]
MPDDRRSLVREFESEQPVYYAFGRKLVELLQEALGEIHLHSIYFRVKDLERLNEKIVRHGKHYETLMDVTDLLGIRVVTYFADDIDRVVEVIDEEFAVDQSRSVDKRSTTEADRFGYISVHKVVQLSEARTQLAEYKRFEGLFAEIQIRSILQHAWAEIEHDLGYLADEMPAHLRRKFSILSGMLELVDEEFKRLRDELAHHVMTETPPVTEPPKPRRIREAAHRRPEEPL